MVEHIPHSKIDEVLFECNRCLKSDGLLRLVCPDLEIVANAYTNKDIALMERFIVEDPTIRKDLGIGGSFMNFLISNGSDSLLISRNGELIAGYAHLYAYDFEMMKNLLDRNGFKQATKCQFLESSNKIFNEPLHPTNQPAEWRDECHWASYEELTGFDRDPLTSLFVEAKKDFIPEKRRSQFGAPSVRGLDPINFSFRSMLYAFFTFSGFKIKRTIETKGEYFFNLMQRIFKRFVRSFKL